MITLKTLPQATAQEVFNQVKEHLLKQNERSSTEYGLCKYRFGKLKCAAGCLISDEEYNEDMEGNSWCFLLEKGIVPNNHADLINQLQRIHDQNDIDVWQEELTKIAEIKNFL